MSAEAKSRTPWALIISIAVNGLLIGLLAGVMLAGGPKRGGPPPGGPGPGGGGDRALARDIVQAAPIEERQAMREVLTQAWRASEADRRAIHEAQRKIGAAMAAESYDAEAVRNGFAEWREADARVKARVQEALVGVIGQLPAERRQALAKALAERDQRRQKRRDRRQQRQQRD